MFCGAATTVDILKSSLHAKSKNSHARGENLHSRIATSASSRYPGEIRRVRELRKDLPRNAQVDHQTTTSVEFYTGF